MLKNPTSPATALAFIGEQVMAAAKNPVAPAQAAALGKVIAAQGENARLINADSVKPLVGANAGLESRAIIAALTTAYGDDLREILFNSSSLGDFGIQLLALPSEEWSFDGHRERGAITRFVTGFQGDQAMAARDGVEVSPAAIRNLERASDGQKFMELVSRGEWRNVSDQIDNSKVFAFEGGHFGVVRLHNGAWGSWFQNDWNRDLNALGDLSTASLQALKDRVRGDPAFPGLASQVDSLLQPRLAEARRAKTKVDCALDVDLEALAKRESIAPSEIASLPANQRVSERSLGGVIALIEKLAVQLGSTDAPAGSRSISDFDARKITLGDDYAHITHAGQPLGSDQVTLYWSVPKAETPWDGGLILLASGRFKIWSHTSERQGSTWRKRYDELEAFDTATLQALRARMAPMAPSGVADPVLQAARRANRFGPALEALLQQIDGVLAKRGAC
ncbi:MAG: hypothetical protein IT384_03230 [Deltaproteobacteria bacterium]|nr:hypothetical protein [Deltaproteobacteria bacterium]